MEFNKPEILSLDGNVAENFKTFKEDVMNYFIATETTKKPNAVQVARLKNLMGKDALQLYNSLHEADCNETMQTIMDILEQYCLPKKNEIMDVFQFITCKQAEGEPFDKFLAKLRLLIKNCKFGEQESKLMRAQIALGIFSQGTQERLLRDDTTLEKMVQYCRSIELADMNMKLIKEGSNSIMQTNQIKPRSSDSPRLKPECSGKKGCTRCGRLHLPNQFCPALGKTCNWCKTMNHFSNVCMRKRHSLPHQDGYQRIIQPLHNIHEAQDVTGADYLQEEKIDSVHLVSTVDKKVWFKNILVGNTKEVNFKLDTGAEVNILPYNIIKQSDLVCKLRKSKIKLEAYGGFKIVPIGELTAQVETTSKLDVIDFIIVKGDFAPILGLEACTRLGLIQRIDELTNIKQNTTHVTEGKQRLFNEFKDVFEGLGCFPDQCSIKLTSDAIPYASSARRIPLKIQQRLKDKLDDLVKKGIIEPVNEPVEWVSNIVIVEKPDGSLRICIDPQNLNKYIVRERFTIPTIDEISPQLANKKLYSVLDIKDGFYHLKLDEHSTKLCNFSTVFGTYRFLRCPFGLSNLPELFHKRVAKYFEDIPGVVVYFDDLCIAANSKEENDSILRKVLDRARSLNIRFNFNKFQYCMPEIKYLGVVFSEVGMLPDPEKVKVIKALNNPNNKTELQSLLGMVNFLRVFIPNLSQVISPLRELLKKDVHWCWTEMHSKALNNIKRIVSSEQVIAPFNATVPIVIQCNASKDALGCCLLQNKKPVYMASRSLNSAEEGYAQVEKELLAVVYACSKLHNYVYGHDDITIQTDHMPLVSLINKPINKIQNNRLKRLRLKLLQYNFKLQYLPGKYMYIADFLSRCGVKTHENIDQTMMDMVHTVTETGIVQFSDKRLEEFKKETVEDEVLGKVAEYYVNGWPVTINSGGDLAHYFKIRADIELSDGLLYYQNRIIIPKKLRYLIINRLHETHLGETKMNAIVSQFYYWPGIRTIVKNIIESCSVCQKFRRSNVSEPLLCHEIPNIPFLKVGADIAECAGKIYLIVIDYYSRWLEIVRINNKTSISVKNALIQIFTRLGIPQIMVADNMPFNSNELKDFAKQWNFNIQTTSPNYPQANGLAEKGVGIAKRIINISSESGVDMNLSLLNYRNSVVAGLNYSPAQLLMGRILRSKLPIPNDRLESKVISFNNVANKIKKNRDYQKMYYDQKCKAETKFKENDPVYIQDAKTNHWEPGVIIGAAGAPRSYMVQTNRGQTFRRNSIFIRRRKVNILKGEDV